MPHPLPLVLLLALGSPAPPAPAGTPVLLWLGPFDGGPIDGPALLDAVTIYTRDLSLQLRSAPGVPPPTAAQRAIGRDVGAGAVIAARGARLGFWCLPSADGRAVMLATVDGGGRLASRFVDRAGLGRPELGRAIALKLRAILAAPSPGPELPLNPGSPRAVASAPPRVPTASPRQSVAMPPPGPRFGSSSPAVVGPAPPPPSPPISAPPVSTTASPQVEVAPEVAPPQVEVPPPIAAAPAGAPRRGVPAAPSDGTAPPAPPAPSGRAPSPRSDGRFFAALGYRLSAPLGAGALQQGITAGVGAHRRGVELELGAAVEKRATAAAGGDAVSLFDLPIALEARWMHRARRVWWGGGAFGVLHLRWATATAPGRPPARAFGLGGGAGVAALVRVALGHEVAVQARLFGELALPTVRYWVAGTDLLERGPRVGVGISLVFPGF